MGPLPDFDAMCAGSRSVSLGTPSTCVLAGESSCLAVRSTALCRATSANPLDADPPRRDQAVAISGAGGSSRRHQVDPFLAAAQGQVAGLGPLDDERAVDLDAVRRGADPHLPMKRQGTEYRRLPNSRWLSRWTSACFHITVWYGRAGRCSRVRRSCQVHWNLGLHEKSRTQRLTVRATLLTGSRRERRAQAYQRRQCVTAWSRLGWRQSSRRVSLIDQPPVSAKLSPQPRAESSTTGGARTRNEP